MKKSIVIGGLSVASVVVVAVTVVACGSDGGTATPPANGEDGGGPAAAPIAVGDPKNVVHSQCALYERCRNGVFRKLWGDMATCERVLGAQTAKDFVDVPGIATTQQQFDECASKLDGLACESVDNRPVECDFKGTLEEGSACQGGAQCTTGSCYRKSPDAACGVCKATAPEGGDCSKAECEVGKSLVCNIKSVCVVEGGDGAACTDEKPCKEFSHDCVNGLCQRKLGKGAPCSTSTSPSTPKCDPQQLLTCFAFNPGDPTICNEVTLARLGEKCGIDQISKRATYCAGGTCPNLLGSTCVPLLQEGASCGTDDAECESDLTCQSGKCTRIKCEAM